MAGDTLFELTSAESERGKPMMSRKRMAGDTRRRMYDGLLVAELTRVTE